MKRDELRDALGGLFAYDVGCTDSGIKDELLRERVKAHLNAMDDTQFRLEMSRYVRDAYLAESQLEQRYGIEDVREFLDWLAQDMGIDV